jgi:hypothetical protein
MKITFVTSVANQREGYVPDKVYDLPDGKAEDYVRCGLARYAIERSVTEKPSVEKAVKGKRG